MREGRIAKYRGGFAFVFYEEGKRHRYTLGKVSRAQAEASANRIRATRLAAQPKHVQTVGEIVDAYFASTEAISVSTMKFHWRSMKPTFGGLLPAEVTEALCKEYASERGVSPGTIRKEMGILRAALSRAKAAGDVWMPPAPLPRDRRLTRDEMKALEAACTQVHLLLFVMIARYTAARAGAIMALKWSQVDFERRRIDLGGMGRQKRRAVVPMHPALAFALIMNRDYALSPYVIEYNGKRIHSVKTAFRAACDRAGIEDASPHVLRHTAASWMAEAGVPMVEIAQFLGHTNPSVTYRVYAKFSPDYLGKALGALT